MMRGRIAQAPYRSRQPDAWKRAVLPPARAADRGHRDDRPASAHRVDRSDHRLHSDDARDRWSCGWRAGPFCPSGARPDDVVHVAAGVEVPAVRSKDHGLHRRRGPARGNRRAVRRSSRTSWIALGSVERKHGDGVRDPVRCVFGVCVPWVSPRPPSAGPAGCRWRRAARSVFRLEGIDRSQQLAHPASWASASSEKCVRPFFVNA